MAKAKRHLGEILYKAGLVEKQPLVDAIRDAKKNNKRLGDILVERKLLSEEMLAKAVAKQFDLKFVDLNKIQIPQEALKLLDVSILKKFNILPIGMENGSLKIAISDPMNLEAMDAVRFRLNTQLDCYVASAGQIRTYIEESLDTDKKGRG